jgi:hypothetical protein
LTGAERESVVIEANRQKGEELALEKDDQSTSKTQRKKKMNSIIERNEEILKKIKKVMKKVESHTKSNSLNFHDESIPT